MKNFVLGILFSVMFIIIYSMININNIRNEEIIVKDISGYGKVVTEYSEKIEKIKNKDCRESMNNILNVVNKTHFINNVSIKEYYEAYSNNSFLDNFYDVVEKCNIKEEKSDPIYVMALASTNYPNSVKEKYMFSYEIRLKDNYSSLLETSTNIDEIGTYTTKALELKTISELLGVVK